MTFSFRPADLVPKANANILRMTRLILRRLRAPKRRTCLKNNMQMMPSLKHEPDEKSVVDQQRCSGSSETGEASVT